MTDSSLLPQIAEQLQDVELVERWLQAAARRAWLLRLPAADAAPATLLRVRCQAVVDALQQSLRQTDSMAPGSVALREPLQLFSFTAGWLAGSGHSITDALALAHGLREVVPQLPAAFAEALAITAAEAFCAARQQAAESHLSELMARSQLVCLVHPQLPCLFLVGEPDALALDDAMGRLLMLALMRQAKSAIVESSGLLCPAPLLEVLCRQLAAGSWRLPDRLLISGLPPELGERLEGRGGAAVSFCQDLWAAIDQAFSCSGLRWPSPG